MAPDGTVITMSMPVAEFVGKHLIERARWARRPRRRGVTSSEMEQRFWMESFPGWDVSVAWAVRDERPEDFGGFGEAKARARARVPTVARHRWTVEG